MSNKMNRIYVLISTLVLVSCSQSIDIQLEPEVNVYLSNDSEQRIRLTQNDIEYMILKEWLHENRSGWYVTSGRYPGGIYIKSGNYGIQVMNTHVVIYSVKKSEPKAIYIQDIEKDELSKIRNIGKETHNK